MYEIVFKRNDKEIIKIEVESNADYFNIMDRLLRTYDHIKILTVKYK